MTTIQDRIQTLKNIFFANGVKCDSEQFLIEDINNLIKEVQEETRKEVLGEVNYAIRNSYREVQSPTGNFEVLDPKFLNEQLLSITNKEKQK